MTIIDFPTPQHRLEIGVFGRPQPAGSKRGFPVKRRDGRVGVAVSDDNPHTKSWQGAVASAGAEAMMRAVGPAPELWRGPLGLAVRFRLCRPKGHFGTGRNVGRLRDAAPKWHTVKPDATKLLRAIEDGLTGVVWCDDAQIVEQYVAKVYGAPEGAHVVVWRL